MVKEGLGHNGGQEQSGSLAGHSDVFTHFVDQVMGFRSQQHRSLTTQEQRIKNENPPRGRSTSRGIPIGAAEDRYYLVDHCADG